MLQPYLDRDLQPRRGGRGRAASRRLRLLPAPLPLRALAAPLHPGRRRASACPEGLKAKLAELRELPERLAQVFRPVDVARRVAGRRRARVPARGCAGPRRECRSRRCERRATDGPACRRSSPRAGRRRPSARPTRSIARGSRSGPSARTTTRRLGVVRERGKAAAQASARSPRPVGQGTDVPERLATDCAVLRAGAPLRRPPPRRLGARGERAAGRRKQQQLLRRAESRRLPRREHDRADAASGEPGLAR